MQLTECHQIFDTNRRVIFHGMRRKNEKREKAKAKVREKKPRGRERDERDKREIT